MRTVFKSVLLVLAFVVSASAQSNLFDKVASLNIGIDGYTLGKALDENQQAKARNNLVQGNVTGIYKFMDGKKLIVADEKTHKVVVIRKDFKDLDQKALRGVITTVFFKYDEPTTLTHSQMFYWAFDENGKKYTEEEWEEYKKYVSATDTGAAHGQKAHKPLVELVKTPPKKVLFDPLVSIKVSSSKLIDDKSEYTDGTAYIMISSEKLLKENYDL